MNFLSDPQDGRPTLRPTNVMVYGWAEQKQTCVDLIGVSPLVGLRIRALRWDMQPSKSHQAKCLNMIKDVLTINMLLYYLRLTLLIF